jgi:hypothetical protein
MRLTGFLLLAALLLSAVAHFRAPEYDEAYSIFLTAGDARPAWPTGVFTPAEVRGFYTGAASFAAISDDLKTGDVHPPLYFWALSLWRGIFGPSWFAARMLSVGFSLAALAVLAWLAAMLEIPVFPALALTLLSYGFAYTGIVARGFALAQLLNLLGVALTFRAMQRTSRPLALGSGLALGAASFANYLAVFTGGAALLWLALDQKRRRFALPVALGLTVFAALDLPYFLAQKSSRMGQFTAFSPLHALALLAKDSGAALFGGLPLYAGALAPAVIALLLGLFLACLFFVLRQRPRHTALLVLAAAAPLCGLLALGFVFNNTPIEIRYLAFSLPYLALLLAASLPRPLLLLTLAVQACAIFGLALAPTTMQPQALAARQASALNLPDALILLPFGNDGVGIPGPFIAAAPDNARIELLRPGLMPDFVPAPQIILATLRADRASRASTAQALAYFQTRKCYEAEPKTPLITLYLNRCAQQQR